MKKYSHLSTFWNQIKLIKKNKMSKLYILFIVNSLCLGTVPVISSFFTKVIIEAVTNSTTQENLILSIVILIGTTIILYSLGFILSAYLEGHFLMLRQVEFNKVIKLYRNIEYKYVEDKEFQDKFESAVQALNGDGMGFQHTYNQINALLRGLVSIILLFILLCLFNVWVAVICLASTIITTLLNKLVTNYQMKRKEDESHYYRQTKYYNTVCTDFEYGKDIRVFDLKDSLMNKYKSKSFSYLKVIKDIQNKEFKVGLLGLLVLLLQDGLSYFLIIKGYFDGLLTIGDVSLYLTAVISFTTILRTFVDDLSFLNRDLKMSSLYFEVTDYANTLNDNLGTLTRIPETEQVEIEFKNVWFKYPNTDRYILKGLNLKINKGEKLAIVGTNGAGKSTIVKLISGLFDPNEGEILINGINVKQFQKEEYYKMFSTVFQDYQIYACSVMENILGNVTDSEKIELAKDCIAAVGLKEKIESLPNGYYTQLLKVVDEQGVDLSGGQKQKIAIARALYKNGNVVILDEPTSALDALAEAEIYQGFDNLVKHKTAIYISHRLSSTRFCDHIAFFDSEGLKEYGTHDELMELKKEYYHMFTVQGQYYTEGADDNE